MITKAQIELYVTGMLFEHLTSQAKYLSTLHFAASGLNVKQKDVDKVRERMQQLAKVFAKRAVIVRERESRRRMRANNPPEEKNGANEMSAPKVP